MKSAQSAVRFRVMKDLKFSLFVAIALACLPTAAQGQRSSPEEKPDVSDKALITKATPGLESASALYKEIAAMDGAVFGAFNGCDIENYKSFFADDTEFYHDKEGLQIGTQKQGESLAKLCSSGWKARRELLPGSLEVYPIPNYGAIGLGTHRFYETKKEEGAKEKLVGIAKFMVLWQRSGGQWKAARVISYDHRPAN